MRSASCLFLPLRICSEPLAIPLLQRASLRVWTARLSSAAPAFAACRKSQTAWTGSGYAASYVTEWPAGQQ
jgi:hypothetical protein